MLSQSCETLPGVGPALLAKLKKCNIHTVADLVFHLPVRYQDRTRITPIADLRVHDYAVVSGEVTKVEVIKTKRAMLYVYVADKTGILRLRFFYFNQAQIQSLKSCDGIHLFGEARAFKQQLEMIHPEYRLIDGSKPCEMAETLTPIYPTTEGLSQSRLRQLVKLALLNTQEALKALEWMTPDQLAHFHFPPLDEALLLLHHPQPDTSLQSIEAGDYKALQRLVFDELLAQRLSMEFARRHRRDLTAPVLPCNQALITPFIQQLPYALTNAQQQVSHDIAQDLTQHQPMLRLIQGDVGCGKTTVAALAALQAIQAGYQVALMVPTDLLSEQHTVNFTKWFAPLNLKVCRLSGKMKARDKKHTLSMLANHECHLLVGTHALFQQTVEFKQLGLIIIDEQHRFGVEQRLLLQKKGQMETTTPHQLLMTATPIPRTLAMTQLAYLDISIIDELPPGRTPIQTVVMKQERKEPVIARLAAAITAGKQVYWVCTLVEESEKLQCTAATLTAAQLTELLPDVRVGLVHGRLKAAEKEAVMQAFKAGEIDLLVATTVIEVGVDVPNASVMVIENAERLGLSQLHQLRGRVGRGSTQSFCLLLYQSPLSTLGFERLQVMKATTDGFVIAEKDLSLRGGGEVLGTKQTGYKAFKIANLARDKVLLDKVHRLAPKLLRTNPVLAERLTRQWLGEFEHFFQG
ncbi:MAG: ATP-dependent DNA helicase RecG [Legionellaceae bacterium]|nr:ATP-dependent DNA helicase RecG [Legionellaceae bacterium]HAF87251.1 ATP-dependent DNA helicase RecG [Legionellales bacterium]